MPETLIEIFNNMEAFHLAAANEAAKAKKLLAGEGKASPSKQRVKEQAAVIMAKHFKNAKPRV